MAFDMVPPCISHTNGKKWIWWTSWTTGNCGRGGYGGHGGHRGHGGHGGYRYQKLLKAFLKTLLIYDSD